MFKRQKRVTVTDKGILALLEYEVYQAQQALKEPADVKSAREWKGQSPGVRIESGHLKNRLPAVRRGRHFPQAGNRAFSQVVRLFSVAVYRPLSRKAGTSENCGFVL